MKTLLILISSLWLVSGFTQSAEDHYLIAKTDVEQEKFKRSIKSYSKAIELDRKNATYLFERGRSYFEIGQFQLAKVDLDEAIDLDTTLAPALHYRALYHYLLEDYSAAIEDDTKAVLYSNNDELTTQCLLNLGECKYMSKDYEGAYEDMKAGLAKEPDNSASIKTMTNILHELKKGEEALVYLDKLIELEPKEIGAYVNKGFELEALGRYQEAVDAYTAATEIDSHEPLIFSNRAHAYYELGEYEKALKDVNKSIGNQPMNAFAYHTRALIHLKLNETDKACKDLSTAQNMGFEGEVQELRDQHCR